MNLSQTVAGRSRNVYAARDFSHPRDDISTQGASTSNASSVALPWKSAIFGRIRAALRGPRHHVMEALVRLSDATDATCWVAMATLAREARVDIKTARKHVHALVKVGGFLRTESMTWAQLCAHRRAAGRNVPRTDNDRNAPYLFTVLDGLGRRASELPEVERRQRFSTRWGQPPRRAQGDRRRVDSEPKTSDLVRHEGYQIWQARGVPNLVPDLSDDPTDQEKSVLVPQAGTGTEEHTFLVISSTGEGEQGLEAWKAILEAYGKHYVRVYEATPTTPRGLKPNDPREAGDYLAEKAGVLADRLTLPKHEAVRSLADRTLAIWLDRKGTGGFLTRESHPLWALCQELPARVNEAFKALIQEHKATSSPKQAEQMPVKRAEKPVNLLEHIRAAREANQFVQGLGTVSGDFISRPSVQPMPEKPVNVSSPEIREVASPAPNESAKDDATSERPKAARPAHPRRIEALPKLPRPESKRSGPRWGEAGPRPARMRHTRAMESTEHNAEPDEPDPIESS
jgi:hypothetical protein